MSKVVNAWYGGVVSLIYALYFFIDNLTQFHGLLPRALGSFSAKWIKQYLPVKVGRVIPNNEYKAFSSVFGTWYMPNSAY